MPAITTHVLDTANGKPAAGVPITLERQDNNGAWLELGRGETDSDGRLRTLVQPGTLQAGAHRLTFRTAEFSAFFPVVTIVFEILDAKQHYHVPLLLSPFGYSTYRGS